MGVHCWVRVMRPSADILYRFQRQAFLKCSSYSLDSVYRPMPSRDRGRPVIPRINKYIYPHPILFTSAQEPHSQFTAQNQDESDWLVWPRLHGPGHGHQPPATSSHKRGPEPGLFQPDNGTRRHAEKARRRARAELPQSRRPVRDYLHHDDADLQRHRAKQSHHHSGGIRPLAQRQDLRRLLDRPPADGGPDRLQAKGEAGFVPGCTCIRGQPDRRGREACLRDRWTEECGGGCQAAHPGCHGAEDHRLRGGRNQVVPAEDCWEHRDGELDGSRGRGTGLRGADGPRYRADGGIDRLTSGAYAPSLDSRPGFGVSLAIKDANHALAIANEQNVRLPGLQVARENMMAAREYAGECLDSSSMYGVLRQQAGLEFWNEKSRKGGR
uniref:3-hydroxyisobutyrate dehydrogenase n=1 Tax=Aspergillus fumigatus TaxID=746128 RepID=Q6MYF1_ASPFM|nr:hypothetical protein AfA6E3.160c [Aspergillus fumigatus]